MTDRLTAAEGEPARLRGRLDRLKGSAAYQSHRQLTDLERHVADLASAAGQARIAVTGERTAELARGGDVERAEGQERAARTAVHRYSGELGDEAEQAGIDWRAEDASPDGLADRVTGRAVARRDDLGAVRDRLTRHRESAAARQRAGRRKADADEASAAAEAAESAAADAVTGARDELVDAVAGWGDRHTDLLRRLDIPSAAGSLTEAADRVGEVGSPTLRERYTALSAAATGGCRDRLAQFDQQLAVVDERRAAKAAERAAIAAEHDDAPAAAPGRVASRSDRAGAPLWRLVRFADGVDDDSGAAIEAALQAAGMLDAWLHPTPADTAVALSAGTGDGYLLPLPADRRPTGTTLADLLVPEEQPDVPAEAVRAVLASVAVRDEPGGADRAVLTRRGQYAHGIQVGGFAKDAVEYLGATARARRRAARIADCDRELAELDGRRTDLVAERDEVADTLAEAGRAGDRLPDPAPVLAALREADRAAARLRDRREASQRADAELD